MTKEQNTLEAGRGPPPPRFGESRNGLQRGRYKAQSYHNAQRVQCKHYVHKRNKPIRVNP